MFFFKLMNYSNSIVNQSFFWLEILKLSFLSLGQGPLFSVAEDMLEIGLGVHGEAGVGSVQLCSASEAIRLTLILKSRVLLFFCP